MGSDRLTTMITPAASRRSFLTAAALAVVGAAGCSSDRSDRGAAPQAPDAAPNRPTTSTRSRPPARAAQDAWPALERHFARRIGVYAIDTGTGRTVAYRADERFAMCSTFKTLAVAAVLHRTATTAGNVVVRFSHRDIVEHSPITAQHVRTGMTLTQLCAAAMRFSDDTAANLLLTHLGGPHEVTRFARTIGDQVTRLDRREPELDQARPGDLRDTTTARAIGTDHLHLAVGTALEPADRTRLRTWLETNTTGTGRIRAAAPATWTVGDRSGGGGFGTSNDIAILWPPRGAPIALSVLTDSARSGSTPGITVIAAAARQALASI